jgi:hypothetical protein
LITTGNQVSPICHGYASGTKSVSLTGTEGTLYYVDLTGQQLQNFTGVAQNLWYLGLAANPALLFTGLQVGTDKLPSLMHLVLSENGLTPAVYNELLIALKDQHFLSGLTLYVKSYQYGGACAGVARGAEGLVARQALLAS